MKSPAAMREREPVQSLAPRAGIRERDVLDLDAALQPARLDLRASAGARRIEVLAYDLERGRVVADRVDAVEDQLQRRHETVRRERVERDDGEHAARRAGAQEVVERDRDDHAERDHFDEPARHEVERAVADRVLREVVARRGKAAHELVLPARRPDLLGVFERFHGARRDGGIEHDELLAELRDAPADRQMQRQVARPEHEQRRGRDDVVDDEQQRQDERGRNDVREHADAGHQRADHDPVHVRHDDLLQLRAIALEEREVGVVQVLGQQPYAQGVRPHEAEPVPEPRLERRERIADDERAERKQPERRLEVVVARELEQRVCLAEIEVRLDDVVVHQHGDERHDRRDARHVDERDHGRVREQQIDLQPLALGEDREQHPPIPNHAALAGLSRRHRPSRMGRRYGLMKK